MNRIAIDLGFIQIYWYSIMILLGVLVGVFFIFKESRNRNINEDFLFNLIFYTIIFGLVGARLYYIAFNYEYYLKYPIEIFQVWNGGLAIHGGVIVGALWIFIYTHKYKINTMKILDIIVVGLMIGQCIGRWGNFFNGEAYGAITTFDSLKNMLIPDFIINGMLIDGFYRIPTFLFESIWTFIGFIVLLVIRRTKYLKIGQLTGTYLIWYSFGRFFIEWMRTDSLMIGNFRIAQIISVILFIIGILIIIKNARGPKLDNLYKDAVIDEINF